MGGFFTGLFANIKVNWPIWLVGVLIASNLFFVWEWRHTDAALIKERASHAADIASFKQAQATADAKAQSERATLLKESKANADQADAHYSTLASQYHASLVRYAGHQSGTKQSGNNQLSTSGGSNGSSSSSDLPTAVGDLPPTITITSGDAQICAVNTARLSAVHDWAVALPKQVTQP